MRNRYPGCSQGGPNRPYLKCKPEGRNESRAWLRQNNWSAEKLAESLASVRHRQGRLIGHMGALGFDLRQEAVLEILTADVLKSSEIEGQKLDAGQVRSSIARRLGIDVGALKPADRHVKGVVEMMHDATRHFDQPLTAERLFGWQAALFPTGRSGMKKIEIGAWRDDSTGPMQIVCGALGEARVHFEAPQDKARFWERIKNVQINDRQRLVINRLLNGFEGKLTTSKYATLAKCSQDTAHRDIRVLVEHGVLIHNPEGRRSTSYSLAP